MVNALVTGFLVSAAAHPLHSSLTTIAWRPETRTIEVGVRVFTQDLQDILTRRGATACDYAQATLALRDGGGRAMAATRCTTEPQGEVTWIRFTASAPGPRGLQLSNTLLFELFADQINIVQASIDGRARTVLFTRGDGLKPLT